MADSDQFPPLSIAVLNRLVRERLETGFPLCWVSGEISNLTNAASGHAYFTLKDESAQVRCVMFRNRNALIGWKLANGQHVEARVLVTLYEARGDFQLNVDTLRQAGVGNLFERFQKLKAKLEAEGFFAAEHKRPLPAFPRRVGIVTSPQAAALRDVLTTLARRAPHVEIVLFPTPVQGEGAGALIATAIKAAGDSNLCDTLIVCRGGGSIEDLWAFNEETVARTIRACPIPVVSGVGHETDFTIADFAADQRAPTPTAAAEMVAPERKRLLGQIAELQDSLRRQLTQSIEQRSQRLDWLAHRLAHPTERLKRQREALTHLARRLSAAAERHQSGSATRLAALRQRLTQVRPGTENAGRRVDQLASRLNYAWQGQFAQRNATLNRLGGSLHLLDPQAVLGRGYAVVRNTGGQIVRDTRTMEPSSEIHVYLAHGRLDASITATDNDDQLIPDKARHSRRDV